jgi:hypothetical protein
MFWKMLGIMAGVGVLAALAGATDVSGPVSGEWTAVGNPYNVVGDIYVSTGQALMIQPGVEIIFQGHYSLKIYGTLQAVGTASDSITFTAADTSQGWKGVRFEYAGNPSLLSYCILEYGNPTQQHPDGRGGAIYCWYSNPIISHCSIRNNHALDGGGISCYFSSPTISDCDIMYNTAGQGGGIRCKLYSNALISHCRINLNTTPYKGGGLNITDYSNPTIQYCEIIGNEAGTEGGGVGCFLSSHPMLLNCTVSANEAQVSGGGLYAAHSLSVISSIFWQNTPGGEIGGPAQVFYSDIFGGWAGIGNINADPQFVNAGAFDFHLQENSPCIDAGDPYSPLDPDSSITDMGAHYFPHASPYLQISSTFLNFGVVHIDTTATLPLTLYNRGSAPLILYDIVNVSFAFGTNYNPDDSLIAPGDSLELVVTFAPPDSAYYSGTLHIESNHVPKEVLMFGIGFFPTPEIVILDTVFDFESLGKDSTASLPLTISNIGSGDLIISQIVSTHPAFYTSLTPDDSLLLPGESLNIQILCQPDTGGILSEQLYVQSNVDTIPLQATAMVGNTCLPTGTVEGIWTEGNSPYIVYGDITVPQIRTLTIEPGVSVIFRDSYKLKIQGSLRAVGTWSDSIKFMPDNNAIGWRGLRFISATDTSRLKYCHITQGKTYVISMPDADGGGIYCNNSDLRMENCRIDYCDAMGTYIADGGGIYIDELSHAGIDNCNISYNTCGNFGGGINAFGNAIISNCTLSHNSAHQGGGIHCGGDAGKVITHCLLLNNWSDCAGGGIRVDAAHTFTIEYCTFMGNSCGLGGGGLGVFGCDPIISNCLIYENHALAPSAAYGGGGVIFSGSNGILLNCTVIGNTTNSAGGGIKTNSNTHIHNCIVRNNYAVGGSTQIAGNPSVNYCNVQGGFTGTGNLDHDPAFVDSTWHDYRLRWGSVCINAGDPDQLYIDPDGTRSDIGAFFYDQSTGARVLLTPHIGPVLTLPPEGGGFDLTAWLTNIDPLLPQIELWSTLTLPNGNLLTPVAGPLFAVIDSGTTSSADRTITIPEIAPGGTYTYSAYAVAAGDTSMDSFTFFKLGDGGGATFSGWSISGDQLAGFNSALSGDPIPEEYCLHQNYPNPFNPTTALSYKLQASSHVSLKVYDTAGRLVTTLVDGFREAGTDMVTFDGSSLPSGVYFYRLQAGEWTAVRKMVLLK